MVEPLAAALLNSVLPTFKVSAVARAMKAHTRPSLTSNFFTPLPRQCKGKAKAVDLADNPTFFVLQCQEWSCCVATHTVCSGVSFSIDTKCQRLKVFQRENVF